MNLDEKRPIIIKKVRKGHHGHHGGAWKIAYADFVTAMMAFFLLMWLIGSTSQADLKGIAEYFENPWRVSMSGGSGAGDATAVIKGGGEDLTRSTGQVKKTNEGKRDIVTRAEEEETKRLEALRKELLKRVEENPELNRYFDQVRVELTRDGLRVQIIDEAKRPMFRLASDEMEPYAREILTELAPAIAALPNRVSISGHTDARPFARDVWFSNWELSADRANAARRGLVSSGLPASQIVRVAGLADSVPLNREDPYAAINRRISILVLNTRAAAALLQEPTGESDNQDGLVQ